MPYSNVDVSQDIGVLADYQLSIAADKRWVKVNDPVNFVGALIKDGVAFPNQTVALELWDVPASVWWIADQLTTDAQGVWRVTKNLYHGFACQDLRWRVSYGETHSSEVKVAVAFPTRFNVTIPSQVTSGVPFTIEGKLEHESSPDTWYGVDNQPIKMYINNVLVSTFQTFEEGAFSTTQTLYQNANLKLKFEGVGIPTTFAPAEFIIPGLESINWIAIGAVAPLVAMGMYIGYEHFKKRKR